MKLLRVVIFGTAALLGATCAASSCRDENAASGSTENDDLMGQGQHDEGGSAHCSETGEAKPMTSFAHEWAMTPAHFASYVGGHGMCPGTFEGLDGEGNNAHRAERDAEESLTIYADEWPMTPASFAVSDVCPDTAEGCQAKNDDADLCGEPADDTDISLGTSSDNEASVDGVENIVEGPQATSEDIDLGGEPIGVSDMGVPSSGEYAASVDSTQGILESVLLYQIEWQADPRMRVVLSRGSISEPASVHMTALGRSTLSSRTMPTKVFQLTTGTQVRAVAVDAFAISTSYEAWTFTTPDRAQRDMWITELTHAIEQTDHTATSDGADVVSDDASVAEAGNPSDVFYLKTPFLGMQPRKVTLAGSALTVCKLTWGGRGTKSCEEIKLDTGSDAVPVASKGRRERGRSLFRVTTSSSASNNLASVWKVPWTFDAGSPEEQARWVALIKGAARKANGDSGDHDSGDDDSGDEHEEKKESSEQGPMRTRFRGWKLGPNDPSLETGFFLRNLNRKRPSTLEVTEVGDILLGAGVFPDRTQEPLWAYRSTGASGIHALGCAVESLWQRVRSRDETRVNLSVKNGRWRVGRGRMCTFGRSPAPEGSLRRFLPWDERGQDITEAELHLQRDGTAIIRSDYAVLWDSFFDGAGGLGGDGGLGPQ